MKTIKILLALFLFTYSTHSFALAYIVVDDCNGTGVGSITLTAKYSELAANAPFHFEWYDESGTLLMEGDNKPYNVLEYLNEGSYFMTITDADGCSGTHEIEVANLTCGGVCNPTGVDPLAVNLNYTHVGSCPPSQSVTITATGGSGEVSYEWSNCESCTSNTNTVTGAGTHNITVTDNCTGEVYTECFRLDNCDFVNPCSAAPCDNGSGTYPDPDANWTMRVSPSIYDEETNLEVELTEATPVKLMATHYMGVTQEVIEQGVLPAGITNISVNTLNDPNGIYIFTIERDDCLNSKKSDMGIKISN